MVGFGTRDGCQVPGTSHSRSQADSPATSLKPENFRFWTARAAPYAGAPLASLSASVISGLGKPGAAGGRVEPHTGYEFPPEYCYLRTKQCPSLAGLGVRSKRIIVKDVNVYALGIYVDTAAAKSALSSYKKRPAEELEKDQAFYDAVLASPSVEKTLRLVISSRLVDRKKFLDALDERLAPKLKEAGDTESLEAYRRQFDGVHFEKGLEVVCTCLDNKKLVTHIGGQQKGVIASPALCSAFFGLYLGPDPVSKEAKSTFGHSLASTIKE